MSSIPLCPELRSQGPIHLFALPFQDNDPDECLNREEVQGTRRLTVLNNTLMYSTSSVEFSRTLTSLQWILW